MSAADWVSIRGAISPDALRILARFDALQVASAGGVRTRGTGAATVSFGGVTRRVRVEALGYVDAGDAWRVVRRAAAESPGEGVLLTAEGMTSEARRILADHGIAYATGSGHLHVVFPPLLLVRDVWRPANSRPPRSRVALSGRGGLVAQALLVEPERTWRVRDLATAAAVSAGMAHRVLARLEEDGIVEHGGVGGRRPFRVADRGRLLEAWCDEQVDSHVEMISCVLDADEPWRLVALLASRFGSTVQHAVTGWSAVVALTGQPPKTGAVVAWVGETVAWEEALVALGATRVSHGGTVVLMRVAGDHPLAFRRPSRGIWCVNPTRLYYDLRSSGDCDDATLHQLRDAIARA